MTPDQAKNLRKYAEFMFPEAFKDDNTERRQVLYSKMFHFMKCHKVITVPVQLGEVCASAGIELVPLSEIVRGTGLPENAVFSIWGNTDGAVNCYQTRYRSPITITSQADASGLP